MGQFAVTKDGRLQLSVSQDLPRCLIEANAAVEAGRISEAIDILNNQAAQAVGEISATEASCTDAMFVLAVLFGKSGQLDQAEHWYKQILEHNPNAAAYYMLAGLCRDKGRRSQEIGYLRKAIETEPDNTCYLGNLGSALIAAGRIQEGIETSRMAAKKAPAQSRTHSTFLTNLHYLPNASPKILFAEHKRWADTHAPMNLAKTSYDNTADPDRKLRVGYVSPDFRMHSVAYFFESLLDGHNREEVEVYGYSNTDSPDHFTERLKNKFDHYRDVRNIDDSVLAELIESDGVDILVDLAGHMCDNRLPVFGYKPAPVQVTYLGYPDTTGMEQIDYRFTDSLSDLLQSQDFYTEELVFLPQGFLCYRPPEFAPPVGPLPAEKNGFITFGSFNNSRKTNPYIMALWAEILRADDSFRLLLKFNGAGDRQVREHYFKEFEKSGVSPERIELCDYKNDIEHLELYNRIDIGLDTYPYNGTTTTCEALWMGVPTVSLAGERHLSRVGLSILSNVGLDVFTAATPAEYVAKAVSFATEKDNLAKIRSSSRQMMTAGGKLCDAKGFTLTVEKAYRKMWHRWCRDQGVSVANSEKELTEIKH